MKTIYLIRHAESDSIIGIPDYDRPLNEKGHQTARKMAKYLLENDFKIEQFISSPTKRALTTARYFAETYQESHIKKAEYLYEPLFSDFMKIVKNVDNQLEFLALFSHNPTISEFASSLANEPLGFPTCAIAVFEIDTDDWQNFDTAEKKLTHFFIPEEVL